MRGWKIALLAVLLAACTDEPRHAPSSPLEPAHSDYAALVNWFAERGITLPAAPPSPDGPAAKAAQDGACSAMPPATARSPSTICGSCSGT